MVSGFLLFLLFLFFSFWEERALMYYSQDWPTSFLHLAVYARMVWHLT